MSRPRSSALAIAAVSLAIVLATFIGKAQQGDQNGKGGPKRVAQPVDVAPNEAARRVEVTIGGRPFTAYIWPDRLKKPVLYPLRSATGTLVTRGWPFDPRPGERVDHPHHVGLWFDYGNVNGVDFWNNSDALKPGDSAKMGVIVLHERAAFTFRGDATTRTVDRATTLTAGDRRVVFNDDKEGLFGLRVARQLEQPSKSAEVFTDASGKATAVPVLDNAGV